MSANESFSGNVRRKKVFVPLKQFRYLPSEASEQMMRKDLKLYNNLRRRCFYAKPLVDDQAPSFNPEVLFNKANIFNDLNALRKINDDNLKLIMKINLINRTSGKVDCFNNSPLKCISSINYERLKQIEKDNKKLYHTLVTKVSAYDRRILEKDWKYNLKRMSERSAYPMLCKLVKSPDQILRETPSISSIPSTSMQSMNRPKIFFDIGMENYLPIGTLVFELYIDVVPRMIKLFLNRVDGYDHSPTFVGLHFYKIKPQQFCELGNTRKLMAKENPIFVSPVSKESSELCHNRPGVLSLVPLDEEKTSMLFSITFQAQPQFDNHRVVIGKLVRGYKRLLRIEELGKKYGSPPYKIYIAKSGLIGNRPAFSPTT